MKTKEQMQRVFTKAPLTDRTTVTQDTLDPMPSIPIFNEFIIISLSKMPGGGHSNTSVVHMHDQSFQNIP